jgi:hypothetical protein
VPGGGGGGVGRTGGFMSDRMHAAMSKNMNSSAFSCGDSMLPLVQPVGKGMPTLSLDETWMSL